MTVSGMEDDESHRMARIYLSTEDLTVETKRMAWLNVVAEKSELMILSGEVLYRFYRYQSAYQLYKTATNAHINITKKAL